MLNVVNFGGGAYVIYAEVLPSGEIEVDPEPYSDTFDRPARLLPIEAKALVAAIDLIGARSPRASSRRAREDRRRARPRPGRGGPADHLADRRGRDRARWSSAPCTSAPAARARVLGRQRGRVLRPASSSRTRSSTAARPGTSPPSTPPRTTTCATSGSTGSRARERSTRRFERRADLDPVADVGGWPRTGDGRGLAHRARLDLARAGALGARGAHRARRAAGRRRSSSSWAFKGTDYLVREILKEAGDAAVLEPADAREAVLAAAERLLAPAS